MVFPIFSQSNIGVEFFLSIEFLLVVGLVLIWFFPRVTKISFAYSQLVNNLREFFLLF